jgi:hypothetical protein
MAHDTHIYGQVKSKTGLHHVFQDIRQDVDGAKTRPALSELYKRAGYLITLTYAPSWEEKFGRKAATLREAARKEFTTTARKINRQAKKIGTEPDYDDKWGK